MNREYKPGTMKNKNELPTTLLIKMIQYSSNEGEVVADFFCGGFSTAVVALGLNRRFVGFEISRQIFDAKIQGIKNLVPGHLLAQLKNPASGIPENAKKAWTDQDIRILRDRFFSLCAEGMSRKQVIERLQKDLGRGHWSIDKALKKNGLFTKRHSPDTKGRP